MWFVYFIAGCFGAEAVSELINPHESSEVQPQQWYLFLAVALLLIIYNIVLYWKAATSEQHTSFDSTAAGFVRPIGLSVAFGLGAMANYIVSVMPRGM